MNELIQQARELCEKATPGPWMDKNQGEVTSQRDFICDCLDDYDAEFIAASRTLVPQLCDALEAAQKEIERIDGVCAAYQQSVHNLNVSIEKLKAENRWIPVSERIPDKYGKYLTCDLAGNMHIFEHDPEAMYPFFIHPNSMRYCQPTHWRPLPEPPKGE